jgi:hypothetical protein
VGLLGEPRWRESDDDPARAELPALREADGALACPTVNSFTDGRELQDPGWHAGGMSKNRSTDHFSPGTSSVRKTRSGLPFEGFLAAYAAFCLDIPVIFRELAAPEVCYNL